MPRFTIPPVVGARVRSVRDGVNGPFQNQPGTVESISGSYASVTFDNAIEGYSEQPGRSWSISWGSLVPENESIDTVRTPDRPFLPGDRVVYTARGSDWNGHECTVVRCPAREGSFNTVVTSDTGRLGLSGNRELHFITHSLRLRDHVAVQSAPPWAPEGFQVGQRVRSRDISGTTLEYRNLLGNVESISGNFIQVRLDSPPHGTNPCSFSADQLQAEPDANVATPELTVGMMVEIVGPVEDLHGLGTHYLGQRVQISAIVNCVGRDSYRHGQDIVGEHSGGGRLQIGQTAVRPLSSASELVVGAEVEIIGPESRMCGLGNSLIGRRGRVRLLRTRHNSRTGDSDSIVELENVPDHGQCYVETVAVRVVGAARSATPPTPVPHTCQPTILPGVFIAKYECGCEQYCPEHSASHHAAQRSKVRNCWRTERGERTHGWSAQLNRRPPAVGTPTSEQAVCNDCDLRGYFTSPFCGECMEFCSTCHREEYVAQGKWLINCWNHQGHQGGEHGWPESFPRRPRSTTVVEDAEMDVRLVCICEDRRYGGPRGVRHAGCGCEFYCPECRSDDNERIMGPRGVTTSRWFDDEDGCWRRVRLRAGIEDRPTVCGWWDRLGERPKQPLPEILIHAEEEVPKVSENLLSATLTNKSGYAHRLITGGWPAAKAERLASWAAGEHMRQKQYAAAQVLEYPHMMLSRELAISRHEMVLGVVGHKPVKFEARQPAVPEMTGLKFDKGMITGRFLDRAGIELEGGWDKSPKSHIFGDGSVQARGDAGSGEIHIINYASDMRWDQMEPEWPQKVDATCGMHVHLSFKTRGVYSLFVCKQFHDWIAKEMARWGEYEGKISGSGQGGEFYKRLRGANTYCKDQYQPDSQLNVKGKNGVRYSRLNYCYGLHHTLEVRVLPMFPKMTEARAVIEHLLLCFEKWAEVNSTDPTVSVETAAEPKKLLEGEGVPDTAKVVARKKLLDKQRAHEANIGQENRAEVRAVRDRQRRAEGGSVSGRIPAPDAARERVRLAMEQMAQPPSSAPQPDTYRVNFRSSSWIDEPASRRRDESEEEE